MNWTRASARRGPAAAVRPVFLAIVVGPRPRRLPGAHEHPPGRVRDRGPAAGGHNAPPRGTHLDDRGEPVYGRRDEGTSQLAALGLPFWLAGGWHT